MTDEMFVKLMRDCGTDEETIAALLAQERQQRITNLEPPLAQTAPSSFPRPADGVDVFERIDRVWKWVQRLDQEKVSQELLGETVEMIGEESGKSLQEIRAQIREESRKETEELRAEIALVRAVLPKNRGLKLVGAHPKGSNQEDAHSQVN